jgi:hypothetical protein
VTRFPYWPASPTGTLREKDVLLNTRRTRKTGKRVALKGKYLLTKEDILKVS